MSNPHVDFIRKLGLWLSIVLTAVSAFATKANAKPVALNIVLEDQIAIFGSSSVILQKLFSEHSPDTEFRNIIVRVPRQSILESDEDRARIHHELKEKISAALGLGDELKYLILNTHGETNKSAATTILHHLGEISSDRGVSIEFADLFASVKSYAAKDLVIVMNACSVFADSQEKSILRAKELLAFFNAPDGLIYGAKVSEVDTLRFQRANFSLKTFFTPKLILSNALISSVASVVFGALTAINAHHLHAGFTVAEYTMIASTTFQYLIQTFGQNLSERLGRINAGYLFEFQGNDIKQVEIIHKMKDLAKSYGLKRSSSGQLGLRCEAVHL